MIITLETIINATIKPATIAEIGPRPFMVEFRAVAVWLVKADPSRGDPTLGAVPPKICIPRLAGGGVIIGIV